MNNAMVANDKKVLVIGSNGKTGRRVYKKLLDAGVPVMGATYSGSPRFDWNDANTWPFVLNNIRAVYISFYPDLAIPGTAAIIEQFTQAAVKAGVKHLVLLSGRGETEAEACEQMVMQAGVDWTIVRASWFCQNFSEGNFLEPVRAGYVALPAGAVGEPFVDADDIAAVAVAALTAPGHQQKVYEVTGPRLLTFKEAVTEIATATGKPIQYEQVPLDAYTGMLGEHGLSAEVIALITYLFTEVLDGRNAQVADGVQQALGRKATDFSEFVQKAAAAGAWK